MNQPLERVLATAVDNVPGALFVGCLELGDGFQMHSQNQASPQTLSFLSSVHAELFEGGAPIEVEALLTSFLGRYTPSKPFDDILVFVDHLLYIFMRLRESPDHVLAVVCPADVNIGMVLARCRIELTALEGVLTAPPPHDS